MTGDPTLAAALDYARRGLPVLPLHSPGIGGCTCGHDDCASRAKHPRTKHGKDDATTDPARIRRWWQRWPGTNVGLRPVRGLVVLDVDPRNGGDVTLTALERLHGDLPRTRTAITGSDGLHLHFLGAATVGKIADGLDVKTAAGYVVAPPSVHACGGTYLWTDESPTAPAPVWLAALLSPPPPERSTRPLSPRFAGTAPDVTAVLAVVTKATTGERNRALYWAAHRLFERVAAGRLGEGTAVAMLLDAATAVGLSGAEAQATIDSAAGRRTSAA